VASLAKDSILRAYCNVELDTDQDAEIIIQRGQFGIAPNFNYICLYLIQKKFEHNRFDKNGEL